jgi:hypothetical protein
MSLWEELIHIFFHNAVNIKHFIYLIKHAIFGNKRINKVK